MLHLRAVRRYHVLSPGGSIFHCVDVDSILLIDGAGDSVETGFSRFPPPKNTCPQIYQSVMLTIFKSNFP